MAGLVCRWHTSFKKYHSNVVFDVIKSVDSVQSVKGRAKPIFKMLVITKNILKVNQKGCKLFYYCDFVSI